jgi:PAS domain-containing protein
VGGVISALNETGRRGTAALAASEQRLAVTLASIGDAVLTTDEHGTILSVNDVAERLTGWTAAQAIGRPIEDVLVLTPVTPGPVASNPVRRALRDGKVTGLDDDTT